MKNKLLLIALSFLIAGSTYASFWQWNWVAPDSNSYVGARTSAVSEFLGLNDTPSSYSGESGNCAKVNGSEDALEFGSCGAGDVVGPGSATDNAIARFDGTTGKLIQNSNVLIDDSGNIDANSLLADYIDFTLTNSVVGQEGRAYWNSDDGTVDLGMPGGNVNLQIGQEMLIRITNNTGSTVTNGSLVIIDGVTGVSPTIALADADSISTAGVIGMATEDITDSQKGYVTTFGFVRDLDTSSCTAGQPLWLSQTAGEFTSTRPTSPAIQVVVGICLIQHATTGLAIVKIDQVPRLSHLSDVIVTSITDNDFMYWDSGTSVWKNKQITASDVTDGNNEWLDRAAWYGTFKEAFDSVVTSDGTTITASLEKAGTGDLTMQFSDAITTLDCTPAKTVALTAGTDTSPQANYVYILQTDKTNLTVSTTQWPSAEHIKIAYFYVQSATQVQSAGALINQNWNDSLSNGNSTGHITHIGQWIRAMGANYFSGVDGAGTDGYITPYAGGGYIKVGSGVIMQMHEHTYIAKDTQTGDTAFVPNYPSENFKIVDDLNDMLVDSTGSSLTNKYYNIIIGGVANKGGEFSPLMIKLPDGSYTSSSAAEDDVDGYSNTTIARQFGKDSSTGFLIARVTLRNQSDTTFTVVATEDLRTGGGSAGGGTGGIVSNFSDSLFTVYNNTDPTKIMNFDASGITTGNTRTLTIPDNDGTLITSGNLTDITTVGTIGTGVWNGTVIEDTYGGNIFDIDTATPLGTPLNDVYRTRFSDNNYITNSSFEHWLNGTTSEPDGWTLQGTATIARDSTPYQGTYSAELTFGAATDGELYAIFGANSLVDYTFSAYVTRLSGTGEARLVAQQNFGSFTEDQSVALPTASGQQLITLTFKPSISGDYRVNFKATDASGSVWRIDEVKAQESLGVATAWTPAFMDDSFDQTIYGAKTFKGNTLEILNSGDQLKLSFDGTDNATFGVDTSGDMTTTITGDSFIYTAPGHSFFTIEATGDKEANMTFLNGNGTQWRMRGATASGGGGDFIIRDNTVGNLKNMIRLDEANGHIILVESGESTGDVGIGLAGTNTPGARLEIFSATKEQLRLSYTIGSVYTDFLTDSSGDLTITTTGDEVDFTASAGKFKSYTADPCGSISVGMQFYNSTSGYYCFCNNSNVDVQMHDVATACF